MAGDGEGDGEGEAGQGKEARGGPDGVLGVLGGDLPAEEAERVEAEEQAVGAAFEGVAEAGGEDGTAMAMTAARSPARRRTKKKRQSWKSRKPARAGRRRAMALRPRMSMLRCESRW